MIDAELRPPESWPADWERCAQAGIGGEVEFATKPALARRLPARALGAVLPVSWATADGAYGMDHKFRSFLERRGVGYVVAVSKNRIAAGTAQRADTAVADTLPQVWKRRPCGDDARGPWLWRPIGRGTA